MPNHRSTSTGTTTSTFSTGSKTNKKRPPVFPTRLYDMLENAERDGYAHVISWMPDGKSFKIHADGSADAEDQKAIVEILKRNFNQTRFKSFLRQLQLYSFERTYKGPHRGECKHELFVRGRRDLLHKKSIEHFQLMAEEASKHSPKSVRNILRVSPIQREVMAFMKKNDSRNSPLLLPSFPPLVRSNNAIRNTCPYAKNSAIPTKLTNLVLSDSESSKKKSRINNHVVHDDFNYDSPLLDKEIQLVDAMHGHYDNNDDDLVSINSGENIPCWTGMELEILRYAL